MATAEAVATGIPVLSYRTGDVDEWVDDSANGYLVEAGDEASFRERLLDLLTSPEKLGALEARNGQLSFPSWDGTFKSFLAACGHADAVSRVAARERRRVSLGSRCELPTTFGTFDLEVYRVEDEPGEVLLLRMGNLGPGEPPFVRVHSECLIGEVLGSLACDCKAKLHQAMRVIAERGRGAILYLRPEGRGRGLGDPMRASPEPGRDPSTVEADTILGIPTNRRDFEVAAILLEANGVDRIHLHTNNPKKITSLERSGIIIESVLPPVTRPDGHNHNVEHFETRCRSLGQCGLEETLRQARD
jgi:GTP cyclohydrolase II